MINIKGGQANVVTAKMSFDFVSAGLNSSNINVIFEIGDFLRSWQPGRSINAISGAVAGRGYYVVAKQDLNLTDKFFPPFDIPTILPIPAFATLAILTASALDDHTIAIVTNDPTSANNGTYKKNIGGWEKTDLVLNILNYSQGQFKGIAGPTTDPGTPQDNQYFIALEPGVYSNFGGFTLAANSFGIVAWNGTAWQSEQLELHVPSEPLAMISDALKKDFLTYSEPLLEENAFFLQTTSIFSGWGTAVGAPADFNAIVMRIKARSLPITSIRFGLFIENEAGTVIEDKTIAVNIDPHTSADVVFELSDTYANAASANLFFVYLCDQLCDRFGTDSQTYFPQPQYQMAKYNINGVQNFTLTTVSDTINKTNWFKVGNYATQLTNQVKDPILAESEGTFKTYFDSAEKLAFNNSFKQDAISSDKTAIFTGAAFVAVTSIFSGWGSPIGTPQNFNGIRFRVKSRSGGGAITSINCRLIVGSSTGTVLQTKTIAVNIPSGGDAFVTWTFPAPVVNSGLQKLFFVYATNALVDLYGVSGETPYPESGGYGQTIYFVNGITAGTGTLATSRYRIWCEIGNFTPVIGFTTDLVTYLLEKIGLGSGGGTPTVRLGLPSQLQALEGKELNVYFDNILFADYGRGDLVIDVVSTKGKQLDRRWVYKPTAADAGTATITIGVSYKGVELISKTATITTKTLAAGSGSSVKVIIFGDSTLAAGQYLPPVSGETLPTNPAISFVGSLGSGSALHEGRSGYKYSDYATVGRTFYKFIVSGVTVTPAVGAVYSTNGSTYTVTEINMASGAGYINCTRATGTVDPAASGTLTNVIGAGDATVAFSSYSIPSANPLWNAGALDVAAYIAARGVTLVATDLVLFNLGINDVFTAFDGPTIKGYIDALIAAWRAAVPGIRIGIAAIIPPTISQDGFGENYNNGQTLAGYVSNRNAFNDYIFTNYDTAPMRTAGTFVVPFNVNIDRVYNFPQTTTGANDRNSTNQVTKYTNGVHPAQSGYNQMSDTLLAFIKNFF